MRDHMSTDEEIKADFAHFQQHGPGPVFEKGRVNGRTVGDLRWSDVQGMAERDLQIAFMALQGVLRMKEIDLARETVARYKADYNYAGAMLTKAQEGLKLAEARNRGEA